MTHDERHDAADLEIGSLRTRLLELERRMRATEKDVETAWTPPHKRLWFAIDGWPLYRVAARRQWRPWHRDRWPWRRR